MRPVVFAGAPSVLSPAQADDLDRWLVALTGTGIDVRRLQRDRYAPDVWDQLGRCLEGVAAVVVFGLRQLAVQSGVWRPGTAEQKDVGLTGWATPWVQLEAGMAIARGLPLLVVAEPGVREGIFDPAVWCGAVHGAALGAGVDEPPVRRWRRAF